jgi:hypothetical protein
MSASAEEAAHSAQRLFLLVRAYRANGVVPDAALAQDEERHADLAVERRHGLEKAAGFLHNDGLAAVEGNLAERILIVHRLGQPDHLI